MKVLDPSVGGQTLTLDGFKCLFITELQLPQSEQQDLTELRDIKQIEGQSMWEYMQIFKDAIRKITNRILESHQREWYIQGLLPFTTTPITQQRIATIIDALEQAMKIEAMMGYP